MTIRHDYDDRVDTLGGTVLAAERPHRLSYGVPPAVVTFELVEHDVVRLTVVHEGVEAAGAGWSFILSNLKTFLESGNPLPMPERVLAAYR